MSKAALSVQSGAHADSHARRQHHSLVILRFRRIGKNRLRSLDGRWTLIQSSPRSGREHAVWCIYDATTNRAADIGTWGQCRSTALQRLKSEAQANGEHSNAPTQNP